MNIYDMLLKANNLEKERYNPDIKERKIPSQHTTTVEEEPALSEESVHTNLRTNPEKFPHMMDRLKTGDPDRRARVLDRGLGTRMARPHPTTEGEHVKWPATLEESNDVEKNTEVPPRSPVDNKPLYDLSTGSGGDTGAFMTDRQKRIVEQHPGAKQHDAREGYNTYPNVRNDVEKGTPEQDAEAEERITPIPPKKKPGGAQVGMGSKGRNTEAYQMYEDEAKKRNIQMMAIENSLLKLMKDDGPFLDKAIPFAALLAPFAAGGKVLASAGMQALRGAGQGLMTGAKAGGKAALRTAGQHAVSNIGQGIKDRLTSSDTNASTQHEQNNPVAVAASMEKENGNDDEVDQNNPKNWRELEPPPRNPDRQPPPKNRDIASEEGKVELPPNVQNALLKLMKGEIDIDRIIGERKPEYAERQAKLTADQTKNIARNVKRAKAPYREGYDPRRLIGKEIDERGMDPETLAEIDRKDRKDMWAQIKTNEGLFSKKPPLQHEHSIEQSLVKLMKSSKSHFWNDLFKPFNENEEKEYLRSIQDGGLAHPAHHTRYLNTRAGGRYTIDPYDQHNDPVSFREFYEGNNFDPEAHATGYGRFKMDIPDAGQSDHLYPRKYNTATDHLDQTLDRLFDHAEPQSKLEQSLVKLMKDGGMDVHNTGMTRKNAMKDFEKVTSTQQVGAVPKVGTGTKENQSTKIAENTNTDGDDMTARGTDMLNTMVGNWQQNRMRTQYARDAAAGRVDTPTIGTPEPEESPEIGPEVPAGLEIPDDVADPDAESTGGETVGSNYGEGEKPFDGSKRQDTSEVNPETYKPKVNTNYGG